MNLKPTVWLGLVLLAVAPGIAPAQSTNAARPQITRLTPPEKDFFSKQLDYHGIPIKAHAQTMPCHMFVAPILCRLSAELSASLVSGVARQTSQALTLVLPY